MSITTGTAITQRVFDVHHELLYKSQRFFIAKVSKDFTEVEVEYPPTSRNVKISTGMLARIKEKGVGTHLHECDSPPIESVGPALAVLPPEIYAHILSFCSCDSLLSMCLTSKYWYNHIARDKDLWAKLADAEKKRLGIGWDYRWEDMVSKLPLKDCRFAMFMWPLRPGREYKPIFVIWAPEASSLRSKMVYCSTLNVIKRNLNLLSGIQVCCLVQDNQPFCGMLNLTHPTTGYINGRTLCQCGG